ncbi:hypothetical protein [Micromonospora sp. RTGN7]|uniref:hypothetical protein n=1 Tax=Micromonospora sp. RTGN7 TaxID=3016526 RepID=UPI0029FEE155|nr:hypothetical protein [Micromonospora sp. RTGN7]
MLGVEFGATHTEVVLTADGPRVIETHVRMGGDEIPALAHDATGVELAEYVVRQTVGEEVLPQLRTSLAAAPAGRSSAIWFAAAPAAGVLTAVEGTELAAEVPGVTEVRLLVEPGAKLAALASSDDRIAYARAVSDSPGAALAAARQAVELLEFQIRSRATTGPTV